MKKWTILTNKYNFVFTDNHTTKHVIVELIQDKQNKRRNANADRNCTKKSPEI